MIQRETPPILDGAGEFSTTRASGRESILSDTRRRPGYALAESGEEQRNSGARRGWPAGPLLLIDQRGITRGGRPTEPLLRVLGLLLPLHAFLQVRTNRHLELGL